MRPKWKRETQTNQVTVITNTIDIVLESVRKGVQVIWVTKKHDAPNVLPQSRRDEFRGPTCYLRTLTVKWGGTVAYTLVKWPRKSTIALPQANVLFLSTGIIPVARKKDFTPRAILGGLTHLVRHILRGSGRTVCEIASNVSRIALDEVSSCRVH